MVEVKLKWILEAIGVDLSVLFIDRVKRVSEAVDDILKKSVERDEDLLPVEFEKTPRNETSQITNKFTK